MEDEGLRGRAAGQSVHVLGLLGRAERGDDETLGVAAFKDGRAVHAGEHARLAGDLAKRLRVAAVGAHAALEHGAAVLLVLQVLEHDVEFVGGEAGFAEFGDEGGLGLLLERLDVGRANGLFLAVYGLRNLRGDDALDDRAGRGLGLDQLDLDLLLSDSGDQFLDRLEDRLDRVVRELQGLDEPVLRDLVGGTLDHEHVLFSSDVDQVERGGEHLLDGRVDHELAVDLADAGRGDGAVPGNVRDGQGGACAVQHGNVGLVRLVRGEQQADDLDFIAEAFGKQGAAGAVAQARREDFLFGGPPFALEIAAGEASRCGVLFAVIDGQGEKVLSGTEAGSDRCSDEDDGLADGDGYGSVGELGQRAGAKGDPIFRDGYGMFLIHYLVLFGLNTAEPVDGDGTTSCWGLMPARGPAGPSVFSL